MTKPNETQVWFDAVIDLLIANGNTIVDDKRWSWDKEGGHCYLTRPIDYELIKSHFQIPVDVILDEKHRSIATLQEYLTISQRKPFAYVQFVSPQSDPDLLFPKWKPLLLKKNDKQNEFPIKEFEAELKKRGAKLVGEHIKTDSLVEPYKSDYHNHSWLFYSDFKRPIGVLINKTQAEVTTFQTGTEEEDIAELVAVFKTIAKKLKLKVWNDQHLEDVLI